MSLLLIHFYKTGNVKCGTINKAFIPALPGKGLKDVFFVFRRERVSCELRVERAGLMYCTRISLFRGFNNFSFYGSVKRALSGYVPIRERMC